MKILNLYAGIGGNRRGFGDEHEVTAVELDDSTADVYAHFFPQDTLVRGNAMTTPNAKGDVTNER